MSIYSMTGFGKGEASSENYVVTVEIKSVNNRFKDYRFKMSSLFNQIELDLKKELDKNIKRGSFDIYVNYKRTENAAKVLDIDMDKVKAYFKTISEAIGVENIKVNPTEFMKGDFYKDEDNSKYEELAPLVKEAFSIAISEIKKSRNEEGTKLLVKIQNHQESYTEQYKKVLPLRAQYQDQIREKLNKKLKDNIGDLPIDDQRYNQEVIYYMEKYDIDEEISRIDIHLNKLSSLLNGGGEVGRKIDFIVQELNRETNTIGSKSAHDNISECVVEMKVQLEKIREQALNLE